MRTATTPTHRSNVRAPGRRLGLGYALGAFTLAALAIWLAPWGLVMAWFALSLALISAGYLGLGPGVFGKRNARLHPVTRVLHGPFILGLTLWRLHEREGNPDDHVTPGIRLGRLVSARRARRYIKEGVTSVLDMTCEHSEAAPFMELDYRNVQVLDLTPPSMEKLRESVGFVLDGMDEGDVYVHCAQGFGRSAIVAAACLLARDGSLSVDEARRKVEQARPEVRLRSARVKQLLGEFKERWQIERSE